jgi:hypothetical protein
MAEGNALAFWSPDHERQFQTYMAFDPGVRQWRNAFTQQAGGPPQIDGGDFNYREAYLAGNGPKPYAHDSAVPHWSSTGKGKNHPTAWMETFMQQFGVDPNDLKPEQWTPQMQDFLRREIGGNTINALAAGRP